MMEQLSDETDTNAQARTGDEEVEVDEEWSSRIADPRKFSHFTYLQEHLDSTLGGRDISKATSSLFEQVPDLRHRQ